MKPVERHLHRFFVDENKYQPSEVSVDEEKDDGDEVSSSTEKSSVKLSDYGSNQLQVCKLAMYMYSKVRNDPVLEHLVCFPLGVISVPFASCHSLAELRERMVQHIDIYFPHDVIYDGSMLFVFPFLVGYSCGKPPARLHQAYLQRLDGFFDAMDRLGLACLDARASNFLWIERDDTGRELELKAILWLKDEEESWEKPQRRNC